MNSALAVIRKLRPGALVTVAVVGAVLGTAWDFLHVVTDAIVYSIGSGRQPLWVPLEFALVYVVGVIGIVLVGSPSPTRSRSSLVLEAALVTIAYSVTALGHASEWAVALILAAALIFRRSSWLAAFRANALPAGLLIAAGPAVEAILIQAGLFHYTNTSLGNIPLWLPLLYANAVPFAIRLAEAAVRWSPLERRPAPSGGPPRA